MPDLLDTLVIGGGPAGLTAAIYLARYYLKIRVIDAGASRAGWIPLSHNHAGYPDGISGHQLIANMRAQAARYGAIAEHGTVERLTLADGVYRAETSLGPVIARTVLLATGTLNRAPPMPHEEHNAAVTRGLLRYCPVCDGYEATDKTIAVLGRGEHGAHEALFLRSYSANVTLIDIDGDPGLGRSPPARSQMRGSRSSTDPRRGCGSRGTGSPSMSAARATVLIRSIPHSARTCARSSRSM